MLSYKDVMQIMGISKSSAYELIWALPHIEHPALRVWESDLYEYIDQQMVYPMPTKRLKKA